MGSQGGTIFTCGQSAWWGKLLQKVYNVMEVVPFRKLNGSQILQWS